MPEANTGGSDRAARTDGGTEIEAYADRAGDGTALVAELESAFGPAEQVTIRELPGGNANDTLLVTWDDAEYVVRVPPTSTPAPELLADIDREYAALAAVEGTPVPAPRLLHRCRDESVLGDEFFVMELLAGEVIEDRVPDRFDSPGAREAIATATVDALADLHDVPVPEAFSDDPATPTAYLERELSAFRAQLSWAEASTGDERRVEPLHDLLDRLEERVPDRPADAAAFVHGDYKPDNLMFGPGTEPALAGVLDWEMAGRGDPLADLGWLLSYWADPADPSIMTDEVRERYADHNYFEMLRVFVEDYSGFTGHPDSPGRGAIVDQYEALTGRTYAHDRFYRALGTSKLAVICEGFFRAYLDGSPNAKPTYPVMRMVPFVLAEQGHQILDGDVPLRP
jgi:aminoglycoside phosphotransferase (APT) family kinase protein